MNKLIFLIILFLFLLGSSLFVLSIGNFFNYFTNDNFSYKIIDDAPLLKGMAALMVITIEFFIGLAALLGAYLLDKRSKSK